MSSSPFWIDNAVVHAITEKMTALEMAAVAEYLSGK